jgi:hypothetical protein
MLKLAQRTILLIASSIVGITLASVMALSGDARLDYRAPQGFNTDFTFKFDCKGDAYPISAEAVGDFLAKKGFRTVDVIRQARRGRMRFPGRFDLLVEGLDDQQRLVTFLSPYQTGWNSTGWYFVGLYSRPSVKRDESFESALTAFVSDTLGCKLRDIQRDTDYLRGILLTIG